MKEYAGKGNGFFFKDYADTGVVYHVVSITKLNEVLKEGLRVNKRSNDKYLKFNSYFDKFKPMNIPEWVLRKGAIYGSLNFRKNHSWHSHSAVLSLKIDERKCWIGNENLANILYEPFILSRISLFTGARRLIETRGSEMVLDYWGNSTSFTDNLKFRLDKNSDYDAEVMIMHDIPPRDISIVAIISDHKVMSVEECNSTFAGISGPIK